MNPRLSVSAMCSFRWSFEQDLTLWHSLGLRHAGLLVSKLAEAPDAKMEQLTAAGISASTLITEGFDLSKPESWEKTRTAHRDAIDLMARFGGHSIYFTPGRTTGAPWRDDLQLLADAVEPSVAYGREKNVKVAIEPSLRTSVSFVNTLRDAIDMAEFTGVSIVADFSNLWMERDFREVFARAVPYIALLQIGDIVIGGNGRPAPGGRAHIGEGELPLARMMEEVLDGGYKGLFDLEVVPADFTAPTDEVALRKGIYAASALLDEFGVK